MGVVVVFMAQAVEGSKVEDYRNLQQGFVE